MVGDVATNFYIEYMEVPSVYILKLYNFTQVAVSIVISSNTHRCFLDLVELSLGLRIIDKRERKIDCISLYNTSHC